MIETQAGVKARQQLRAEMEAKDFDAARMAAVLGIREQTLTDWLSGKSNYPIELKVRKYLDLPVGAPRQPNPAHVTNLQDAVRAASLSRQDLPVARDPAPAPEPNSDDAAFIFFAKMMGGAAEATIRIALTGSKIGYTAATAALLGQATHVRIGYRPRDGAVLITPAPADTPSGDSFRLAKGGDISAAEAASW